MIVYLVPAGRTRHELYCEAAAVHAVGEEVPPTSLWARLTNVFRRALAEGEAERTGAAREHDHAPHGRFRRFITRKLAEAVAEQRLLWLLRKQEAAELVHPDDLDGARALEASRALFAADRDRHRRWCVIDALLTIATTPIALLPGPNVFAYYFIFRTVGHYLSMRGAQHGLAEVRWTATASAPLTDVRAALGLEPDARCRRLEATAAALGLDGLVGFVERVADTAS